VTQIVSALGRKEKKEILIKFKINSHEVEKFSFFFLSYAATAAIQKSF
jgi:hypothetical protein